MKHNWILLALGCALMACDKTNVDFGYSPTNPRAGESITFTNLSSSGEEWEWSFGDATTSAVKNPTKIYKQAGTYTVTLKVDSKANRTKTRSITVVDTVPDFSCSIDNADSLGLNIYDDVTFTALVYNPYNYKVEYQWSVGSNRLYTLLSETTTEETFKLYFEQASSNPEIIHLAVTLNGVTREVEHTFMVNNVKSPSVLMMTEDSTCLRQHIFGNRAGFVYPLAPEDTEGKALLDAMQDTVQTYNDREFKLSELQSIIPTMKGFCIAARKIYFRTDDGLFVANIDGSHPEPIRLGTVLAQCTDSYHNRIYWSVPDSVYFMPLIGSENNKFTTTPTPLNNMEQVVKITIDPTKR